MWKPFHIGKDLTKYQFQLCCNFYGVHKLALISVLWFKKWCIDIDYFNGSLFTIFLFPNKNSLYHCTAIEKQPADKNNCY